MEQVSDERYKEKAALLTWSRKCDSSSIPNKAGIKAQRGVEFTMTPVRLHGSSGSRDCEDMRAYH